MSYTEIYKVLKNGDVHFLGEVKNSFRSAMKIWDILDSKYLPEYEPYYRFNSIDKYYRTMDMKGEAVKEVWNLVDRDDVDINDKLCLISTFDNVIFLKEDLPSLLNAFQNFNTETSLIEQADIIENELLNNKDLIGIAWNQTSVNAGAWEIYDEDGEYERCYNIYIDSNHYLYSNLKN